MDLLLEYQMIFLHSRKNTQVDDNIEGLYQLNYKKNPCDFELPENIISVFRGYPWSLKKTAILSLQSLQ